tara:strand:- start:863 stop:1618 length:756 start_codon:yes stop_codon:yes gene_type:complete
MKVVILCGGKGTRISEYSSLIPKPMLKINNKPILWHIMNIYSKFGYNDFVLPLGYKGEVIKDFFLNYKKLSNNFRLELGSGKVEFLNKNNEDWKITFIDTGDDTLTGERLIKIKKYIDGENFLLTYGDGISDINISNLVKFHKKNNKIITMTAVRPNTRFGDVKISGNTITSFKEKPQLNEGWINGGFFVINKKFLNLIKKNQMLEKEPMTIAVKKKELVAYKHNGFWYCIDSKKELDYLNKNFKKIAKFL